MMSEIDESKSAHITCNKKYSLSVSNTLSASYTKGEDSGSIITEHICAKRAAEPPTEELIALSENKPLAFVCKRQRTKSGADQMEPSLDNVCTDRPEIVNGLNRKTVLNVNSSLIQPISAHNPLCERNIRLDIDNIALNKNKTFDKNTLRLPSTDIVSNKPTDSENNVNIQSSTDSNSDINNSSVSIIVHTSVGLSNGTEDNTIISDDTVRNNSVSKNCSNHSHCESHTLTSAITSLANTNPQRSASTTTLDYVARLPDGCTRQLLDHLPDGCSRPLLDVLEDCGSTPPYTGLIHQYSGDEDDDNYLDSSDEDGEDDGTEAVTNIEEDESCGEDDCSVVSTVGSTCSLRSVASEALAAICRNDQGQTTNQDGSLLYNSTPSPRPLPAFSPSLFSHVPPVLKFCQHNEACHPLPDCVAKLLKWRYTPITPLIIRKTVFNSGFKMTKRTILWSGTWGKHMKSTCFKSVRSYQKVNHFPGTFQIGRKDKLWNNFLRLQAKFGKEEFGFMPKTFILPAELNALKTAFEKEGVKKKWIVKPPASARGTGIQVVDKWSQLDLSTPLVVQRYVSRPYLINNTKFDLRIYVAVTSFHPLRIYLYQDGLVRFASVEYRNESTSLSDRFMHLTNYSVNKTNSSYTHNTEAGQCQGHRWTLCTLWGYLKAQGVDTGALWSRIADMVIKTILSGEHDIIVRARKNLRSKYSCFELFGFDVLLDEKLRPWLLEVNISPSLHSACSLDYMVKGPLIAHLLTMTAFHVPDHRSLTAQMQAEVLNECGLSSRVSRLSLDHRLYTRLLTDAEHSKHAHINSLPRQRYMTAALEVLTPDDVRHLVLGEDEIHRAGKFTCIFPTAETHQYFGFLDKPRYYNRLWDAWENTYGTCREKGIQRLEQLCAEKYHLIVPSKFKMPKVVGTPASKLSEDSISLTKSCSGSTETATTIITSDTPPLGNSTDAIVTSPEVLKNNFDSYICETNLIGSVLCGNSALRASWSTVASDSSSSMTSSLAADGSSLSDCPASNAANKRPSFTGTKSGCKKTRLMRKRKLHVKVNPMKPAEGSAYLLAGLVVAGRQDLDNTDDGSSDEVDWEEQCPQNAEPVTDSGRTCDATAVVPNIACDSVLTSEISSGGNTSNAVDKMIDADECSVSHASDQDADKLKLVSVDRTSSEEMSSGDDVLIVANKNNSNNASLIKHCLREDCDNGPNTNEVCNNSDAESQ